MNAGRPTSAVRKLPLGVSCYRLDALGLLFVILGSLPAAWGQFAFAPHNAASVAAIDASGTVSLTESHSDVAPARSRVDLGLNSATSSSDYVLSANAITLTNRYVVDRYDAQQVSAFSGNGPSLRLSDTYLTMLLAVAGNVRITGQITRSGLQSGTDLTHQWGVYSFTLTSSATAYGPSIYSFSSISQANDTFSTSIFLEASVYYFGARSLFFYDLGTDGWSGAYTSSGEFVVSVEVTPVPEPTLGGAVFGGGALLLAGWRAARRRPLSAVRSEESHAGGPERRLRLNAPDS